MTSGAIAAVDLGASSGRVIVGNVGPDELGIHEVHRFPNEPVALPDGLHWDVERLYHEILVGLRLAVPLADPVLSIGIDSWGVDYALLDADGALVGTPYHYRDPRSQPAVERVHGIVSPDELYARTGIQFLPFNTLYQLRAEPGLRQLEAADRFVMIPDLFGYWLSGVVTCELTNASTTSLLDARDRTWAHDLIDRLGIPGTIFPAIRRPGDALGPVRPAVSDATGAPKTATVTLVGSHDTASAVVGVPGERDYAYIACGTWALVGVELERPVLTPASRVRNFTNEVGVDGTVRFLRNVMGLWLLQESIRHWERAGRAADLDGLVQAAGELPAGGPVIDPDAAEFLPPGDMPARIVDACRRTGGRIPTSRPEIVRCILDSLAGAFSRAVRDAHELCGHQIDTIHLVGGGARNEVLCQLTADACERTVVAGPAEATAIGNVLVQARAAGLVSGGLDTLRALVRATQGVRRFEPRAAVAGQGDRAVKIGP
jgi:rhamnulokinase